MARGKHSQAVAVKREAAEQAAEVATYQRRITEQRDEIKRLEAVIADTHRRNKAQVARLSAEVREATSPALVVAERTAIRLREERDAARQHAVETQKHWDRAVRSLIDYAGSALGLTPVESMEWVMALVTEPGTTPPRLDADSLSQRGLNGDAIERIQRARRQRS